MKIRTDFVTNSSSSSFILARKGGLTEKQKEAIVSFVEKEMMGKPVLTPESTEEEIKKFVEWNLDSSTKGKEKEIRKALKEGKTIYSGDVNFEFDCCEYIYSGLYKGAWKAAEDADSDALSVISGELNY